MVRVRFIGHPGWVNAENHLFQVRRKGMNCRFYISPPHSSKSALTADAVCQDETGGTYWGSCNEHWTQLGGSRGQVVMPGFGGQKQQLPEYPYQAKDEHVLVSQGLCHPSRELPDYFHFLSFPIKRPFVFPLKGSCSLLVCLQHQFHQCTWVTYRWFGRGCLQMGLTKEPPSQAPLSLWDLKVEVEGEGGTGLLHIATCSYLSEGLGHPALAPLFLWVCRLFHLLPLSWLLCFLFLQKQLLPCLWYVCLSKLVLS